MLYYNLLPILCNLKNIKHQLLIKNCGKNNGWLYFTNEPSRNIQGFQLDNIKIGDLKKIPMMQHAIMSTKTIK